MLLNLEDQLKQELSKQQQLHADKSELSSMLTKAISERKEAQDKAKTCYDNMCDKEREKSHLQSKLRDY